MLMRRARDSGQTLAEYIRERVLAEAGCEEQVFRLLADELTRVAGETKRAIAEGRSPAAKAKEIRESPEAQRHRIMKEIRESLTQRELDALARLLKPAFDAGLWPS